MEWSSSVAREAVSKYRFEMRLSSLPESHIAHQVWIYTIFASNATRWTKRARALRDRYSLSTVCVPERGPVNTNGPSGQKVRERVQHAETAEWLEAAKKKTTLALYVEWKQVIENMACYDNTRGSQLLEEARCGALRKRTWRARFTANVSTE